MEHEPTLDAAMQLLQNQANEWCCRLRPEQLALLRRYAQLLSSYSGANVIGTKEPRRIVLDHVLDSLSCLALPIMSSRGRLIDVGSGGGLPGVPLAVAQTELAVTLLEATQKKASFLRDMQANLQLRNITVLRQRAEVAGKQAGSREDYDIAVTRALASLPVVVEYCAPLVREGGWLLAMKGRLEQEELTAGKQAAKKLGADLQEIVSVRLLPELEQKRRQIVAFRKTGPTPTGYPRRVGLAKKWPLGS